MLFTTFLRTAQCAMSSTHLHNSFRIQIDWLFKNISNFFLNLLTNINKFLLSSSFFYISNYFPCFLLIIPMFTLKHNGLSYFEEKLMRITRSIERFKGKKEEEREVIVPASIVVSEKYLDDSLRSVGMVYLLPLILTCQRLF